MRILGRSLLLLFLILLIWLAYGIWSQVFQNDHLDLATPYPNAVTERNDVYLLSTAKTPSSPATLIFNLDQRIERLQIAAIPLFPLSDSHPERFNPANVEALRQNKNTPKYAIEYSLFDDNNTLLSHETYWFNAKPTPWAQQPDQTLVPELFVSDANYYAGTRQSIYLRMENWPSARKLELRMHHQPNEIDGASVYVRQHFNRDKEEITALWRKLSDNKRTRYTQNVHMYPHYIWSSNEIDSLLSNYWQQQGPEGIVGKDFTTMGLYRVVSTQPAESLAGTNPSQPTSSLIVSENKNLTFPIHTAGEVKLSFRPLQTDAIGKTLTLTLHPFDSSPAIIIQQLISQAAASWTGILPKGLLELSADPVLEIELQQTPDELTASHTQHLSRYYWITADKPLTYPIEHWRGQKTPIKIELRAIISQPGLVTAKDAIVNANWITTKKGSIDVRFRHRLNLDYQTSSYEHFSNSKIIGTDGKIADSLSEEKSAYYLAAENINQLQITSTSPVLVKVSSRPFELPLVRTVPTHNRGWFDEEDYLPTWFPLRPEQHHILVNQGDSAMIRTQHRPLVDRYAALDEEFIGEQIPPNQAQANLNQILLPVNNEEQLIASSSARRYRQLNSNNTLLKGPMNLNFINDNNRHTLSPSLIFQSNKSAAREVTIKLDNQDIHSQWISGHWGKVTLPKISKGSRTLDINNTNETWLVNHVDYVKDADYLLLKEAFSLNKRSTITYTIKKESSETLLNFTYYQELANKAVQGVLAEDTVIEVKLLNIKQSSAANVSADMSSSMTIPIRHWRLLPDSSSSEQGLMLNRGNRKTNSGTHFVYSLGDDLPAGKYQIQFSLIEGSEGYLNVSRLTPKPGTEIDYFRESIHAY
jgi:hypothetical protein